ncbi:MAG TPA: 3-oxoacyl-[acyl-carrier-protein] reductase [Acidimicrobiia bacterium]|nr:3-oxoacyl-[acyl-carrier-protein] reductase [Acidimicrobiia bacterium]
MSRVALVTGGSRGIGRAIALGLAQNGHRVAVNYSTRPEAAESVVTEIRSNGGEAIALGADVSDEAAVGRLISEVGERLGPVEVLVNNAGVTRDGLLARMSSDDWDRVIEVNLRSTFLCTKAVMRGMLKNRWGRIISIGSVSGLAGNPGQANYAASKAAVIGFTKSVAKEVGGRGITVNVVAPGFIETDMTAELGEVALEAAISATAVGRLGRPEDVAAAVAYLAGENAGFVTGQVIVVDGGLTI